MPALDAPVLQFYDSGRGANVDAVTVPAAIAWLARRDRHALFDLLAPVPGLTALDAGCGAGHHARELTARGLRVTAVDFAPRMLARVRPYVADTIEADLETLALGRTFDRILCAGVLEFLGDAERGLGRLATHLAPGGRLVVMVPRRSLGGRIYQRWHRRHNAIAVQLFSAWQLDRVAAEHGLALVGHVTPFLHSLILGWERPRPRGNAAITSG